LAKLKSLRRDAFKLMNGVVVQPEQEVDITTKFVLPYLTDRDFEISFSSDEKDFVKGLPKSVQENIKDDLNIKGNLVDHYFPKKTRKMPSLLKKGEKETPPKIEEKVDEE
jgi:hypothetical protein